MDCSIAGSFAVHKVDTSSSIEISSTGGKDETWVWESGAHEHPHQYRRSNPCRRRRAAGECRLMIPLSDSLRDLRRRLYKATDARAQTLRNFWRLRVVRVQHVESYGSTRQHVSNSRDYRRGQEHAWNRVLFADYTPVSSIRFVTVRLHTHPLLRESTCA